MAERLKPFRVGAIRVDFPVILSPLAGYSDLAYRLICRRFGAEYCTSEMMLDKLLLTSGKLRNRLVKLSDADHPVAGQLIGNEPQTMARAGVVLCEMGFDAVDLNFACPVRKALSRRRGGYLMRQPKRAIEIVQAVIGAIDRPVTLKLRRSFRENDQEGEAFRQIAGEAFDAGAAAICIHARSVEAKYTGKADWDFIAAAKQSFPDEIVIGSGDVLGPADALKMLERTGVDAVAAARGVLGNPWFFQQAKDLATGREPHQPSLSEQGRLIAEHFAHACELYGPQRGPKIMRKFGIRYARIHPRPREVRQAFVAARSPADWQAVLDEFY